VTSDYTFDIFKDVPFDLVLENIKNRTLVNCKYSIMMFFCGIHYDEHNAFCVLLVSLFVCIGIAVGDPVIKKGFLGILLTSDVLRSVNCVR
jgi:hypothetical protein